jgi:hypothetical protein
MDGIHMSHFRGESAGQSLKWEITIIYDLSVLIYQRDFYRTAVNFLLRGGACKAIKSVFIDPYTRLPDSNNSINMTYPLIQVVFNTLLSMSSKTETNWMSNTFRSSIRNNLTYKFLKEGVSRFDLHILDRSWCTYLSLSLVFTVINWVTL